MRDAKTISGVFGDAEAEGSATTREVPSLVIAWSSEEPDRIGEVALFSSRVEYVLGRGEGEGERRAAFVRQRPGEIVARSALADPALSRRQLTIVARSARLEIARVGRCPLVVNGVPVEKAVVGDGDTVMLGRNLLLLCTWRAAAMPPTRHFDMKGAPAFAAADAVGMLGESPLAWELRDHLAFAAGAGKHLLLRGPSGTGKELAARFVHHHSARADRPFVARNAATLPSGIIDAELFGNARNYPNPGMSERPGLVGQADGGTFFLDEIGELASDLQAHLLRVLDREGEYQRLGEATSRRSDFLLIGATNREPEALKRDLLARLALRIELPALESRREDIPLFVRHLLREAAKKNRQVERFVGPAASGDFEPRVEAALVESLLRRDYETHVREIDAILWRSMAGSPGDTVVLPDELRAPEGAAAAEPTAEQVRLVLEREKGNVRRAAQALKLSSRYALYRLMKKHGIEVKTPGDLGDP